MEHMIQVQINAQIAMFNAKHVLVLHKHNVYPVTLIGYLVVQHVFVIKDFTMIKWQKIV